MSGTYLATLRLVLLIVVAQVPTALYASEIAYVLADRPTDSAYTPANPQTFTPSAEPIVVTRSSTGLYSVSFGEPLLSSGGNAQVSGASAAPAYCKSFGWTPRSVTVACFSLAGEPVDSEFTLLATLSESDSATGYLLANRPAEQNYTPDELYTSASMRGSARIQRTNPGFYYVFSNAIPADGANYQVTAVGRDSTYCILGNWKSGRAEVLCFAPGGSKPRGTPADSGFSLLVTSQSGHDTAFAWNYEEVPDTYVSVPQNARSSDGSDVSFRSIGKGRYEATLGSILNDGATVQVTAQNRSPGICNVDSWRGNRATVSCFDLEGYPSFNEFQILARRAMPNIDSDISRDPAIPPIVDTPTTGDDPATIIDFDSFPDGSAVDRDRTVRFEYQSLGGIFPGGVRVHRCATSFPCTTTDAANQAAAPPAATEFRNQPFEMLLTQGRQRVSLYVVADTSASAPGPISAIAYGESGEVIDSAVTPSLAPGEEARLTLRSRAQDIARVVVSTDLSAENLFHVDGIQLYGDGPLFASYTDLETPTVRIIRPTTADRIFSETTEVAIEAGGSRTIASIDVQLQKLDGEIVVPYADGSVCGSAATSCGALPFEGSIGINLVDAGYYRIFARACSVTGMCSVARQQVERAFPERQDVDFWVMGLEYNQQWQDTIYTDLLNDGSEAGRVPLRHPSNRDTELALPVVAGKPMVVRAYIGLRDSTAAAGVLATGRLRVNDGTAGGRGWVLSPLSNEDCQDHLGRGMGQRCLSRIEVAPPMGSMGYVTNTPYDIDLVQRRIHWEGTLNFVLPAEVTAAAIGAARGGTGLNISFEVFPVDQWDATSNPDGAWNEVNPADNRFDLQLENTRQETLQVRLIRVGMPGAPAPSSADARRAVEEVGRILPLSNIDVDVESEYFYDGSNATIRTEFFGNEIDLRNLNQCQTLWLNLYFTYGLNPEAILVGLVADEVEGCGGVGWNVPNLELLREGRGRELTFGGGIAHSRMPDYSAGEDWARVAVLAMEMMHAHHDARHVSNLHGEAGGCPLTDGGNGAILGFVADALGLGLDMSCFQPEVHPHGTIGSYPPTVVRIGRPGDVSGTLGGARVFGNLGGFGVRIDPVGRSYRLTMYDPCPTGPLDLDEPMERLHQRVDPDAGYRCDIAGNTEVLMPHDVMSYGNPSENRWYSIQVTPGLKNPREGL